MILLSQQLPQQAPRLHAIDPLVQANMDWLWQKLRDALSIPIVIVDTAAHQTNYAPANYFEGAIYFASDTKDLYVDSSASGTPTWVKIA